MIKYLLFVLSFFMLTGCAHDSEPMQPDFMDGEWTYTGNVCNGVASCGLGSLPSQCAGLNLFRSIYIEKFNRYSIIEGVETSIRRSADGIILLEYLRVDDYLTEVEHPISIALDPLNANRADFRFADGCELEFVR